MRYEEIGNRLAHMLKLQSNMAVPVSEMALTSLSQSLAIPDQLVKTAMNTWRSCLYSYKSIHPIKSIDVDCWLVLGENI